MELTSVYTPLKNTASLVRVVFELSVFYFHMTPWYTFVVLLGTNLDRMNQVRSGGFVRNERATLSQKTVMRKKHILLLNYLMLYLRVKKTQIEQED